MTMMNVYAANYKQSFAKIPLPYFIKIPEISSCSRQVVTPTNRKRMNERTNCLFVPQVNHMLKRSPHQRNDIHLSLRHSHVDNRYISPATYTRNSENEKRAETSSSTSRKRSLSVWLKPVHHLRHCTIHPGFLHLKTYTVQRLSLPAALFQQNLGGQPDRQPFLSTLEPSPTPRDTGTALSAVDIYFKYTSHIILIKIRSETLSSRWQKPFLLSLGKVGRPPLTSQSTSLLLYEFKANSTPLSIIYQSYRIVKIVVLLLQSTFNPFPPEVRSALAKFQTFQGHIVIFKACRRGPREPCVLYSFPIHGELFSAQTGGAYSPPAHTMQCQFSSGVTRYKGGRR